jgi:hypothetical protein
MGDSLGAREVGFVAAVGEGELSFAEICERFEISRKTATNG